MTEIPFLVLECIFTAVWLIVRIIVWLKQKKVVWKREAMLLLMYVNLAVIIRSVFFPMETVGGKIQPMPFDPSKIIPFKVNLIPFVNLTQYDTLKKTLLNVIGNTCMFIPTGIILPILYKRLDSFIKVVAAGAGISLCIELIQLLFYTRTSDVDDLILNTLGVIIGYGIYALVRAIVKAIKKRA